MVIYQIYLLVLLFLDEAGAVLVIFSIVHTVEVVFGPLTSLHLRPGLVEVEVPGVIKG